MELQPISILSLFETNKSQRASFVNQVIETLNEGQIDPLKLVLQVKCTEQLLSDLKDRPEYKEAVLSEASKYGKKFEHYNAEFQVKEAGVNYDYKPTRDANLFLLYDKLKELQDAIKERESMLKSLPESGMVDPDTGEMLYPPVKISTTIVQVSLK